MSKILRKELFMILVMVLLLFLVRKITTSPLPQAQTNNDTDTNVQNDNFSVTLPRVGKSNEQPAEGKRSESRKANYVGGKLETRISLLELWIDTINLTWNFDDGVNDGGTTNEEVIYDEPNWESEDVEVEYGYKLTPPEKNPYSVVVLTLIPKSDRGAVCTGTLLTMEWVLSAAHCFTGELVPSYDGVVVIAGGKHMRDFKCKGCQVRTSSSTHVHTHPDFSDREQILNDLALVKVSKRFRKCSTVQTMGLSHNPWTPGQCRKCRFTGFGRVQLDEVHSDDNTRKTNFMEVTSPCKCFEEEKFKERLICNRPKEKNGLCKGDSGGGLICNNKLVAIATVIYTFDDVELCLTLDSGLKTKCGLRNTVSVFSQTYPFLDWIHSYAPDRGSCLSLCKLVLVFVLVLLAFVR